MASVFIDGYHVYYSIVDGRVHEFEKLDENGEWQLISENHEEELIRVAKLLIKIQTEQNEGFSAFVYKLADEGKVTIPGYGIGDAGLI